MSILSCRFFIVVALALARIVRTFPSTSTELEYDPILQPRQPVPSQGQAPAKRSLHRRLLNNMSGTELAVSICPNGLHGCPIAQPGSLSSLPASFADWQEQGFECVDLNADLRACGGCASLNAKHDCTTIVGADGISCVAGSCFVESCLPNYTPNSNDNSCIHN